jgi:hypothetical protein
MNDEERENYLAKKEEEEAHEHAKAKHLKVLAKHSQKNIYKKGKGKSKRKKLSLKKKKSLK